MGSANSKGWNNNTAQDTFKCLQAFEAVRYDQIIDIDENIRVRFNDAGHMLGSAIIEVWVRENGKFLGFCQQQRME